MAEPIAFWLASMAVGLAALPIAVRLCWRLPDAGAGLAFALGVTLAGYLYFLLRSASIIPAGAGGALLAIVLLGLSGAWVAGSGLRRLARPGRVFAGAVVAAGLFTFLFFVFVSFRSYLPAIEHTEQPMDLMYLSTAMESEGYPPEDAWLAGNRASYYYFGYVQAAMLSSASGVPSSTGFNLHLGFVFAAAGTAAASLGTGLTRWLAGRDGRRFAVWGGGAALAMLLFAGSLSTWFEWAAAHGRYSAGLYDAFGVERLLPCGDSGAPDPPDCFAGSTDRTTAWYPTENWWWFRASRVLPQEPPPYDTITEFPAFSFVLGDLHPHLMSIPLVALMIAVAAVTWRGARPLGLEAHRHTPEVSVVLAVLIGALAFQNAWDLVTFAGLFAVAVLARNLRGRSPRDALLPSAGYLGPIAGLAALLYFPWYADFSSQAGGIYAYTGTGTRPAHEFLQFGVLLAPAAVFLAWRAWRRPGATLDALPFAAVAPAVPLAGWVALAAVRGDLTTGLETRTAGGWVTLSALGALLWGLGAVVLAEFGHSRTTAAITTIITFGVLLLFGIELFFIRDVFYPSRFNSVFKLSYQAWVLLSVAGGAVIVAALANRQLAGVRAAAFPAAGLLVASLLFPVLAAPARTNGFTTETSIDGLAYVARNDPDEYALTRWISGNTPRGSVIIEASGRRWEVDSSGVATIVDTRVQYTDASRISARTGRPTPLGWDGHEAQWRGTSAATAAEISLRQDLLDSVYLAGDDAGRVLQAMSDAGADYVVVGRVELDRYPAETLPQFDRFLERVFEAGDLRVYRLPRSEVVPTS